MSKFQQIEVSVYRQGNPDRIALCPLQVTPDPSGEQDLLEYNAVEIGAAISAAIEADRANVAIQETTVQNPFTNDEVWEVLFTDGERQTYVIEYE